MSRQEIPHFVVDINSVERGYAEMTEPMPYLRLSHRFGAIDAMRLICGEVLQRKNTNYRVQKVQMLRPEVVT